MTVEQNTNDENFGRSLITALIILGVNGRREHRIACVKENKSMSIKNR